MRPLKVYGWAGNRNECPAAPNGSRQTREIVAATAWAAAERAYGERISRDYRSETWNDEEVAQATSKPGVVFWRPNNFGRGGWTEAKPYDRLR